MLYTCLTFYFDQINLFYFHFESWLVIKGSHSEPGDGGVPYRNSRALNRMAWDKLAAHKVQHVRWRTSGTGTRASISHLARVRASNIR